MRPTALRWHLVASALLLALTAAHSASAADEIVTVPRGTAYEMTRDGAHWVARVYVAPTDPKSTPVLTMTMRAVALGARADPGLTSIFPDPARVPPSGPTAAFDIVTADSSIVRTGTYDVVTTVSDGPRSQTISLQLTIPAAALAVPTSLIVTRVLPLLGGDAGRALPLTIAETGWKSPATLRVLQQGRFTTDAGEYDGQLTFEATTVKAGNIAEVPYRVSGTFPLGSARATLAIAAPELAAPVSVPVEMRTRRSKALLAMLLLLGLSMGFLMRTYLAQQIQLGEVKRRGADVLRRLNAEERSATDSAFRRDLAAASAALKTALESARADNAETLKGAVAAADTAAANAAAALQSRLAAVAGDMKELDAALRTQWRLPASLIARLRTAAAEMADVRAFIEASNSQAARDQLESLRDAADAGILEAVRSWKHEGVDLSALFDALRPLVLPDAQARLETQNQGLIAAVRALPDSWSTGDGARLRIDTLTALQSTMGTARQLLHDASLQLASAWDALERIVGTDSLPDPGVWRTAAGRTAEIVEALNAAAADLRLPTGFHHLVAALGETWSGALHAQTDEEEVLSLVDAGKYQDAAAALARVLRRPKPDDVREEAFDPSSALLLRNFRTIRLQGARRLSPSMLASAVLSSATHAGAMPPDAPPPFAVLSRAVRNPLTIEALEARTWRELFVAKAAQWALSAIGLALVGYFLFEAKFTGTSADLMAAFFWGFTSDIGVDALLAARKTAPADK